MLNIDNLLFLFLVQDYVKDLKGCSQLLDRLAMTDTGVVSIDGIAISMSAVCDVLDSVSQCNRSELYQIAVQ